MRYISDVLYVPLRSGQTVEHRIVHRGLKSGTEVEIIDQSEDETWLHVKTNSGTEGWIQTQYLLTQPIARHRITQVNQQLEQLKNSGGDQVRKLVELQNETSQLSKEKKSLEKSTTKLSSELAHIKKVSANAIRIDQANNELIKKNQLMEVEIEQLKAEREKLENDNTYKGLKYGAIIMIIGLFIGLIAPMLRNSRPNSGWA
ncbi:MAG: TIGR04211 family SH3 domain-containing protein [Gammaproteobacteria bacterium]|nr:TIGR04211 family SH3 domain-containing protein [Gammaproteobacteria bacterium]